MSSDRAVLASALAPGTEFAGYRIDEVIARGGMGVVYRATDPALDRTVALKVIAPEYTGDPAAVSRFKSEAKLAAAIDHPHLVTVYHAGEFAGVLFLAMQFVRGTDLGALLQERARCDLLRMRRIVAKVASALDAAHRCGLVHRDVKPANILLAGTGDDEHVFLTDFGVSKRLGASTASLTQPGQWVGTPSYTAPEQILGLGVDARTDVYSLGCVVYELLTGHPPYEKETTIATLWAHVSDPPPSPCTERPDLLPAFDSLVARAIAKEPPQRFESAGALAHEVENAVSLQLPGEKQKPFPETVAGDAAAIRSAASTTQAALPPVGPSRPRSGARRAGSSAAPRMPPAQAAAQPPSQAAEPEEQPRQPATLRSAPAQHAQPPARARRRRPLGIIVGTLIVLIAALGVVFAITLPGATTANHAGRASPPRPHAAPAPTLAQDAHRLNDIVSLFIAGKDLSHVEHQYAAAAQNRQVVLQQLAAFHAPPQLRPAANTLQAMTTDSLAFNRDMARGESALARGPDNAHNALRPRFVAEFNPYAQRYLGRTYTINDF